MNDTPRYATLRDYLRVLREQRWIVLVSALVFAGAGLGLALSQKPTYRAEASFTVQDESGESSLLGGGTAVPETAAQRAADLATSITRPEIVRQVKQLLGSPSPLGVLSSGISTNLDTTTSMVSVDATATNRGFAAQLASAYVKAAKAFEIQTARAQYATTADALRKQFQSLDSVVKDPVTRALYGDRISRATILAQTADPVQIQRLAGVPSTPVAPRPVRNALLGLLIGLTFGVLAAFTRDSLDRRMRSADEVTEALSWPIMGQVRDDALGRTGLVPANGRGPTPESEFEAFRILRQNLQFLDIDNPPKSIVVTSALPEEGKSTVAVAVACASATAGNRTLLVECDLRRPSLAGRLGIAAQPGLSDYLLRNCTRQEALQTVSLIDPGSLNSKDGDPGAGQASSPVRQLIGAQQLIVIAAGTRSGHETELLGSERCREFLAEVCAAYDVVVIDTAPLLSVADTLELLPAVDAALVCVRADRTTREQAAAMKRSVERLPSRPIGVVVTGVRAGSELDYGYYSYSYAYTASR